MNGHSYSRRSIVVVAAFLGACAEPVEDAEVPKGVTPFHAVAFDHKPSREEVFREWSSFVGTSKGVPQEIVFGGGTRPPTVQSGTKLVIVTTQTGSDTNDGTDDAASAYFTGTWRTPVTAYSENFVLDVGGRDDLDRGKTNVFYYVLTPSSYIANITEDVFTLGKIGNSSSDRWKCSTLWMDEINSSGVGRSQTLDFNTSVQAPAPRESMSLPATNGDSLYYGTLPPPGGGGGGGGGGGCLLPPACGGDEE